MRSKKIPLFTKICLKTDIPLHGLKAGDVGVLLDYVPHPDKGGRTGCHLEFFNTRGDSVAVITVPETAIRPLGANAVWSVRMLGAKARRGKGKAGSHRAPGKRKAMAV